MSVTGMLFGALLSAVAAGVLLLARRERRPAVIAAAAASAFVMPVFWNSILNWTGATGLFSHDLAFPPFPISWQDTGSGVFTLAGVCIALMAGPCRNDRPAATAGTAALTALAALVVDVYFY